MQAVRSCYEVMMAGVWVPPPYPASRLASERRTSGSCSRGGRLGLRQCIRKRPTTWQDHVPDLRFAVAIVAALVSALHAPIGRDKQRATPFARVAHSLPRFPVHALNRPHHGHLLLELLACRPVLGRCRFGVLLQERPCARPWS